MVGGGETLFRRLNTRIKLAGVGGYPGVVLDGG